MSWHSPLRTATFRMVALAAVAFAICGIALILALAVLFDRVADQRFDRVGETITQAILDKAGGQGSQAVREEVAARSVRTPSSIRIYLLEDQFGHWLAGNLQQWPDSVPHRSGGLTAQIAPAEIAVARFLVTEVPGGGYLLVGTPLIERSRILSLEIEAMVAMAVLMLLAGIAAGMLIARRVMGRLEAVNQTASTILAGDLTQRVPVSGQGDEFDHLAANINTMLDRIQRLLGTVHSVTHNIAHDLRAPLNRLRGRMELALMAPRDTDGYQQVLACAISEADEIIHTFNAMLEIARLEGGATAARFEPLDAGELMESLADLYQPLAEENGLALVADISSGHWLRGDRHLLSQALSNLVDNALKYSPAGGSLRLGVERFGNDVRLSVCDDGPGIPADQRQTVLQPFVRLDPARSTPGSGLGLSLVAAVAELHGGRLALADNQPGLAVFLDFPASSGSH